MNCKCNHTEIVLGVIVLVFLFWQTMYSTWIIAIAALLLIVHALSCKNCKVSGMPEAKKKRK